MVVAGVENGKLKKVQEMQAQVWEEKNQSQILFLLQISIDGKNLDKIINKHELLWFDNNLETNEMKYFEELK